MEKYRIGYLDDEPGQGVNFYHGLKNDFDVNIIEIDNISIPSDIVNEIEQHDLELLVLDFKLDSTGKSFNADTVFDEIRKWNPYFPIIILTSHEIDAYNQLDNVNMINSKGDYLEKTKEGVNLFVLKINSLIKNYKNKKEATIERLEQLIDKKMKMELSQNEEEEYYKLYQYIDEVTPSDKIMPSHLKKPENISSLYDLLNSAKEILNRLGEEN